MPRRLPSVWLPRLLFGLTASASVLLIHLVFLAPLLHNRLPLTRSGARLLAIFAQDATLRRTALASGVGLIVTAFVFFRPLTGGNRVPSKNRRLPPPPTVAGA